MTSYTPLHLNWPGLLNARDLGGMPLSGGGSVPARTLVRSEALSWLRADGVAEARAYRVGRIIDLRRPPETVEYPHPFANGAPTSAHGGPEYLNLPVQEPDDPEEGPWAHLYEGMLERRPELFARAVGAIAEAPEGPVLVHCAAGKDRTGLVVAFALSLAGADDELIADDYELTSSRLAPRAERWVAFQAERRARHEERVAALRAAGDPAADEIEEPAWLHPERSVPTTRHVMLETLARLRSRYGSVAEYLDHGGLGADRQATLVARMRGEA